MERGDAPHFAALLQAYRNRAGLSQEELAAAAGLSPRGISYVETGHVRRPRRATLVALADALELTDLDRAALLTGVPSPHTPAGSGPWSPVRQLPPDVMDFTGRDDLVDEIVGVLTAPGRSYPPIVTIVGPPGVGKSALAVHVSHRVAHQFPDAHLYVNLRGATAQPIAPATAQTSILRSLGNHAAVPTDPDERTAHYRTTAARHRLLVLLDDAHDEEQVRPLVPGGPDSAVVVTSRRTLALAGTRLIQLDTLTPAEASDMLTRIVGAHRTRDEPAVAAQLVRACGHLPLAIRIAATRAASRPTWSLQSVVDRLGHEATRVESLRVGDLAVEASFAFSYDQLDARQARAFRLLAQPAMCDIREAEAAAVLDVTPAAAGDLLATLADVGLLRALAPDRYRYHDLVRLYARSRRPADRAEPDGGAALARLLASHIATIRNAWAVISPAETTPHRLNAPAAPGLRFASADAVAEWGHRDRADIFAVVRQAADDPRVTSRLIADVLYGSSIIAALGHGFSEVAPAARAVIEAARRQGDHHAEAIARLVHAHALLAVGRTADAGTALTRARRLCTSDGSPSLLGEVLHLRGVISFRARRLTAARRDFAEAAEIHKRLGDRLAEATVLGSLARVDIETGRADRAVPSLNCNLDLFRALGDTAGVIATKYHLGRAFEHLGRAEDALLTYAECVRDAEAGRPYRVGEILLRIAAIHLQARRYATAIETAERAVAFYHGRAEPLRLAEALDTLGRALQETGQVDRAHELLDQAQGIRDGIADR